MMILKLQEKKLRKYKIYLLPKFFKRKLFRNYIQKRKVDSPIQSILKTLYNEVGIDVVLSKVFSIIIETE